MRTRLFHIYIAATTEKRKKKKSCLISKLQKFSSSTRKRQRQQQQKKTWMSFFMNRWTKKMKNLSYIDHRIFFRDTFSRVPTRIWLKNSLSRNSRLMPVQVFKAMYLNIPRNTFDCRESLMVSQVTLKKFISTWISKDSSTSLSLMKIRHKNSTWEYPLLSLVHYEFKP